MLSRKRLSRAVLLLLALSLVTSVPVVAQREPQVRSLEKVMVSGDGRGFVYAGSKRPFHPWGHNYSAGPVHLLEDRWEEHWEEVASDFREMRALGSNVVRVHLQFGKFMEAADRPDRKALERLGRLLDLAERTGLYLDVTGLACYRKADVPAWYDALDETGRWEAQARFWEAVAARCAGSPAVFCYDLLNEPISPAGRRKPGDWYSGSDLGGFDFLQYIALDPAGRPREEIARQWIRRLTAAIRKHDRRTPVTVGLLPWTPKLGHLSGFIPEKVAPELDFVSVHYYPQKGKLEEALAGLEKFAVGKPLVIEETFPLSCPASELEQFLLRSREVATGWIGHYAGETLEQYAGLEREKKLTLAQGLFRDWLELFVRLRPRMLQE